MTGSTLGTLRSLPRPFLVLLAGVLVNRIATFIVPYLTVLLQRHYGMTDAETGLVILAFGTGTVISILTGGILTDVLGRRRTMLVSLLGGGALAVAVPFAGSTAAFVGILLLYGFVGDLYRPAVSAVLADVLPPERRAAGFAVLRTAFNLGWAVGITVGGVLEPYGPKVMFVGDGLTTLAFGLVILLGLPETRAAPAAGEEAGLARRASPGALAAAFLGDGVFRRAMACSFAWAVLIVSWMTVFPLTATESPGGATWMYGVTMGLNGFLVAGFQIPVVHAVRARRLRSAAAGMLVGGVTIALVPLGSGPAWWIGVMAAYTFGEMLVIPQLHAFVADWAPPEARGTYVGFQQSVFSLVFAVAPLALLPLRRAVGDAVYWPMLLAAALPAALLLLRLDRTADRPELLRGAR